MRAISLVKRISFEFVGNVVRDAITLGDVDNDGANELIVGSESGNVSIFKGKERYQNIGKLSFVSCLAVGDVLNKRKNSLVIVTADGWCYIYEMPDKVENEEKANEEVEKQGTDEIDGQIHSSSSTRDSARESVSETPSSSSSKETKKSKKSDKKDKTHLICIHKQRIPANVKNIVLGDVDNDGLNEMVLGLTDRVVRSYRWNDNPDRSPTIRIEPNFSFDSFDKPLGKFVALNKWECANQIGSITLHHSLDGKPSLLIAQPGGTFMRIHCSSDDNISGDTESKNSSQGETIPNSVDYQFLGITRMRNQNIMTEIIGDLHCTSDDITSNSTDSTNPKSTKSKGRPYALATLDGTIMLVQDEVILWAMAVDHQIFALNKLDVTGNGSDDIVACAWDGQTYILDQEKNSVRFHLEEPVQAFHSGWYGMEPNQPSVTALVYVTFKNSIKIYYDIPLKDMVIRKYQPNLEHISKLFINETRNEEEALEYVKNLDKKTKRDIVEHLLYHTDIKDSS